MTCSPKWLSWSWRSASIAAPSPCSLRSSRRCRSFMSRTTSCHRSCSSVRCWVSSWCCLFTSRVCSNTCMSRSFMSRFSSRSFFSAILQVRSFSYSVVLLLLEKCWISSRALFACSSSALISLIFSACSGVIPFPMAHSCAVWTMDSVCSRSETRSRRRAFSFLRSWNFPRTKSSGRAPSDASWLACAMRRSTGSGGSSSSLSTAVFAESSRKLSPPPSGASGPP
mmetsp:Transcript_62978/g.177640  ORF Transcript_62978/g.177640 Transcript_62978/m.177640 type:complete len:225 (+) Transcript_62978:310-984(+)